MEAEININFRKAFELVINEYEGKYYIELMEKKEVFEKFTGLLNRVSIIQ